MTADHAALERAAASPYISLTTFRRNGVGVATPVWAARSGDELAVITVDGTGKTKRLAKNDRVELRPCDVRGRVAQDAPTWTGRATVVRDPAAIAEVRRAITRKYVSARVGDALNALTLGVFRRTPRAGIRIVLD